VSAAAVDEQTEPRLLAGVRRDRQPVSLDEHLRRYGEVDPRVDVVDLVARAGLTGRGGAAFPTARKLTAVRDGRGRPVVVANGAEGEPPSAKDKTLLGYVPHLVLDGAVLAAHAVGAREAIVAVNPAVHPHVQRAVAERRDRKVSLRVVAVPDRFVAGEETALVQYLNGGPALPTFTPPRPYERGVGGAPTLVQNVETLAHIALIARFGASWFRSAGTAAEPGTTLVTLSGAVRAPGVYEIPLGRPLAALVADAGGAASELQAFLVGGFFGTWIAANANAALADDDLSRHGGALGARAVIALPASMCGVAETARIARYLAAESAGQCGPCVHGLAAVADGLDALVHRERRVDHGAIRRRLGIIAGRGACSHPDGAVRLVASAYRVFGREVERHAQGKRCSGSSASVLPLR
jgi:NADH:ubiquinone oxidoreductase subunit F (NADH-binding)